MHEHLPTTNRPVTIYISAAAELMAEREALARMIATLPVTLAWRIVQTPLRAEPFDLEALQVADLHFLIMGNDIRAPVGLEWRLVQRAGGTSLTFLKQGIVRTPAGQVFVRETQTTWRPFSDAGDLSRQVRHSLIAHLLRSAIRYALTPVEMEQLQALQAADPTSEAASIGEGPGHSAIILSRERFMPSDGVIVDEP